MIEERGRGPEAGGKEGRPRRAAARLMGDEPKLDEPQAEPAISFGQRDRGPALFLRDGPEGLEDRVPGFEQREQRFGRDMGFEDAARIARARLLPLVVQDRHAAVPPTGPWTGTGPG